MFFSHLLDIIKIFIKILIQKKFMMYLLLVDTALLGNGQLKKYKKMADEMVKIINQTKINLNLSNAISYKLPFLIWALHSPRAVKDILLLRKTIEQVKGRHYEINGCGGFQLSYNIPGLEIAYEIDKEIAVYNSVDDLIKKILFFLNDDKLREEIAENGYKRAKKDHSAQNYMKQLISNVVGGK